MPSERFGHRRQAALALVLLLAVALRIHGIGFGLPAIYNPDETPILNRALAIAQDLTPQNFVYPSLYFYLVFIWEGLYFVLGRVTGAFSSLGDFQQAYFTDPSGHFLAGRLFSVLCGTLTVLAVYLTGRRLFGTRAGLASAAAMAVSPIAVRDAHYVKLDVPTTMFVAFAHLALARLVTDPDAAARRRHWILAGLISGLAVSTQYYAIFLGFTMIGVALADLRRSHDIRQTGRLFGLSVAAAAVGFFAGSPFIPFNLPQVLSDVAHVREVDIDRAVAHGHFTAVVPYLRILLWDAMGWPIWLAAVIGFVWALATDWRRGLLLVSFFAPYFLFLANTVPMSRYLNVVLPMIALAAGGAIAWIGGRIRDERRLALLVTLPFVPGLFGSIDWDRFLRTPDTRTLAGNYITASIPAGTSLLVQPYGPPLRQSREALIEALRKNIGSEKEASTKFQLMLGLSPYPRPSYRLIYLGDNGRDIDKLFVLPSAFTPESGLAPLRELGIEYVILKTYNTPSVELKELEAALAREGRRIAVFSPYRLHTTEAERQATPPFLHNTAQVIRPALERPGPTVEIWDVRGPAGANGHGALK